MCWTGGWSEAVLPHYESLFFSMSETCQAGVYNEEGQGNNLAYLRVVAIHGSLEPFLGRNQSLLGKPITGH